MAYSLSNKCAKNIVNGRFYFNLSSKTWLRFLDHTVYTSFANSSTNGISH